MEQHKVICFHGTDAANAVRIRREGFKKGTFFAKHLENALEFGGTWVFQICFDVALLPPGCWQFRIREKKSHVDIVRLTHYARIKTVFENSELRESIFESDVKRLDDSS